MRGSLSTHTDSDIYSSTLQYIGVILDGTGRAAPPSASPLPLPSDARPSAPVARAVNPRSRPSCGFCTLRNECRPDYRGGECFRSKVWSRPPPLPCPPSRTSRAEHKNMESKIRNLSADEVAPAKLLTKHARGRGTVVNTRPRDRAYSTPYPRRHWLPYSPMQANQRLVLRMFLPREAFRRLRA